MPDASFERGLERMFGEAPAFPDADLFVFQVTQRLERGWTLRQALIGGLGLLGGLIGAAQVLSSGLIGRLGAVTTRSDALLASGVTRLADLHLLPAGFALNAEALFMSAALALVAVGFALTRAIRWI